MFRRQPPFLTPEQAEYLAAAIMKEDLGFRDAKVTTLSGDGGIDVISRKGLAQVKHWNSQIGRPDLQRLYGARGAEMHKRLLFFSSGGYSPLAVEYADGHDIALFGFADDSKWWPVNQSAKKMARGVGRKIADAWNVVETTLDGLSETNSTANASGGSKKIQYPRVVLAEGPREPSGPMPWRTAVGVLLILFSIGPMFLWDDPIIVRVFVVIALISAGIAMAKWDHARGIWIREKSTTEPNKHAYRPIFPKSDDKNTTN